MDILSRVKALDLPVGQYVVFGSAVMEVHGIRKARDVDIVVSEELHETLKRNGWKRKWFFKRFFICKALVKGHNEAFTNLYWKEYRIRTNELIKNAEMIDDIALMSLLDYLEYKKHLPRNKDMRDARLIEEYLKRSQ